MKNLHFLIDVDGVVADIVKATLQLVGKHQEKHWLEKHAHVWNVWDTFETWEYDTVMQCVHQSNFWENMPVIHSAKKAIKSLRKTGHKITWVTAPTWECYGWCDARVDWLWKHFGQEHNIILSHDKKDIHGDVFIDDKLEYIDAWSKNWPDKEAYLFQAPYNQVNSYNWDDILKIFVGEK